MKNSRLFFLVFIILQLMISVVFANINLRLSVAEEKVLTEFFHALFWSSEIGYVLYGDKPIFVEHIHNSTEDMTGKMSHRISTAINAGIQLWKKKKLPTSTPNYLFIIKDEIENRNSSLVHLFFINKKSFKKIFSQHNSLFRYVYGPQISVKKFLRALESTNEDFFSFMRNDKVLIGILLGFGLENAFYVSRAEQIQESIDLIHKKSKDNPFFFSWNCPRKNFIPLVNFSIQPSFGYSSIEEELNALNQKIDVASSALENYSPKLIFGRKITESHLTESFLSASMDSSLMQIQKYEEIQLKLIQLLESSNWLKKILSDIFGENVTIIVDHSINSLDLDVRIVVPFQEINFSNLDPLIALSLEKKQCKRIASKEDSKFNDQQELLNRIGQILYDHFIDENSSESLISFIEGMKEADKRKDAHYVAPYAHYIDGEFSINVRGDNAYLSGFKYWSYYKFSSSFISFEDISARLFQLNNKRILNEKTVIPPFFLIELHQRIFENIEEHEKKIAKEQFYCIEKDSNHSVRCLIENSLYYNQITAGQGDLVTSKSIIKLSYTLKSIYGNFFEDCSSGIRLDLSRAIRAFRETLPFMRVGEKGTLLIHPNFGLKDYLMPPYISPYMIANFEIIDL